MTISPYSTPRSWSPVDSFGFCSPTSESPMSNSVTPTQQLSSLSRQSTQGRVANTDPSPIQPIMSNHTIEFNDVENKIIELFKTTKSWVDQRLSEADKKKTYNHLAHSVHRVKVMQQKIAQLRDNLGMKDEAEKWEGITLELLENLANQTTLNTSLEFHEKINRSSKFITISNINKTIIPQLTDNMDYYF